MGALPPVFIEFLGSATGFHTTAKGVRTELAEVEAQGGGNMAKLGAVSKAALLGIGIAAGVAAVKTIHMAADFQTQMTRVRTGAGEAAGNMKLVGDGVLAMAGQVGQSTQQLTAGLYTVESAGFHGANALQVLKVSAMGAKVGAADLATVTDATTTALNAYSLKASDSTHVMNALVATEAEGKTNMEALAGSMSSILPVAASAHVGLNEVLGAMATMTMQGTSAKVAATYLRQTIGQLSNPTAKAAQTMKGLGLDSVQVAQNLGKNGLASTLTELTSAIEQHMGPAGTVLITTLQKASKNTTAYQQALAKLPPAQKTYIGALATMVGGTKSMMAALQLTGPHMQTFKDNVAGVAEHVRKGGNQVEGWAEVQKTFNQRVAEAKGYIQALGIKIGQHLLPIASKFVGFLVSTVQWFAKHKAAAEALGGALAGVLAYGLYVCTVAAWSFTAALLANPVTWIVIGIMALGAAIVLLITHWKDIAAWLSGVWSSVVHGLAVAWHWLASETVGAWHDIVHALETAWHAVAAFFSAAWHQAVDPIVGAWHWVQAATISAWNATLKFLEGVLNSVVGFFVSTWQSIADFTASVWNGISGFFKKWWPLLLVIFAPFIAVLMNIWKNFHALITGVAVSAWRYISNLLATVWIGIRNIAATAWSAVSNAIVASAMYVWHLLVTTWNGITTVLQAAWSGIKVAAGVAWSLIETFIVKPTENVWRALVSIWNTIGSMLSAAWRGIQAAATAAWALIKSAMVDPMVATWHTVTRIIGQVGSTIWNGLVAAWNSAKSIGSWFESIGSSIVHGIINGIGNAAGGLFDSLKNLAGNALSSAKSFLGINSPSKVFAEVVGKAIPEGIAKGVTDHAHLASSAVTGLSSSLAGAGNGLADEGLGLGTSGGGGGVVINHYHFHTEVHGSVLAENQLRDTVETQFLQLGARRPASWAAYKR